MASSKLILYSDISIRKPEEVLILDVPGAPQDVKGLSVHDGAGNRLYKQPADQGTLSDGQRAKLQSLLDGARMIVGFSVNYDLQVLGKEQLYLYDDVCCIDLNTTFTHLRNKGLVKKSETDCNVKKLAEYFGFDMTAAGNGEDVNGRMKWKIFDGMTKFKDGFLAKLAPKINSLKIRKLEAGVPESDWIDITDEAPVEPSAESAIEKIVENQGLYETLIPDGGDYVIVRMSEAEYSLFLQIQNCRKDYTVKLFYETILKPGILQRLLGNR